MPLCRKLAARDCLAPSVREGHSHKVSNPAHIGSQCWSLLLVTVVASGGFAQATQATLIGTVRDTSGTPVALARLSSAGMLAISDTAGRFTLVLPGGATTVAVRRLGFAPRDTALELREGRTDSLFVVLKVLPFDLPGVTAEADAFAEMRLSEFYRHRRSSEGHFFDRKEIEARRVTRISDLLRRLPGVRMVPDRSGRVHLRMARASGGRDCPPDYFIDGVRAQFLGVDDLPITDIEAIEVYSGPARVPPEYNTRFGNPSCGTIVLWTRVPG